MWTEMGCMAKILLFTHDDKKKRHKIHVCHVRRDPYVDPIDMVEGVCNGF